uniref:Uncharacterized protein n=1 Tax=Anopheles coluzzii TaxID=1518534 RepID=A0A8W7PZG7_ANOCL
MVHYKFQDRLPVTASLLPGSGPPAPTAAGCLRFGSSGFMAGKSSTSLMLFESVRNMVSRSMPMPQPPVGGRPYSSAVQKFSSTSWASSSPAALWGSMCRHGDSSLIRRAIADSSPFFVLPGTPVTPMMSPRRNRAVSSKNSCSLSYAFAFAITCSFRPSPRRSKKISLTPDSRIACTRPATLTVTSSSVSPSCSPLYRSMNSPSETVTLNLCGYGCVSGLFFSSATAALRSLKYSFGEISSRFSLAGCFLSTCPPSVAWAAAALFSCFSFSFASALSRRFSSLEGNEKQSKH